MQRPPGSGWGDALAVAVGIGAAVIVLIGLWWSLFSEEGCLSAAIIPLSVLVYLPLATVQYGVTRIRGVRHRVWARRVLSRWLPGVYLWMERKRIQRTPWLTEREKRERLVVLEETVGKRERAVDVTDKWREIRTRLRMASSDAWSAVEFRNPRWLRTAWLNLKLAISALWWERRGRR